MGYILQSFGFLSIKFQTCSEANVDEGGCSSGHGQKKTSIISFRISPTASYGGPSSSPSVPNSPPNAASTLHTRPSPGRMQPPKFITCYYKLRFIKS